MTSCRSTRFPSLPPPRRHVRLMKERLGKMHHATTGTRLPLLDRVANGSIYYLSRPPRPVATSLNKLVLLQQLLTHGCFSKI
jgi:hypothetical protein